MRGHDRIWSYARVGSRAREGRLVANQPLRECAAANSCQVIINQPIFNCSGEGERNQDQTPPVVVGVLGGFRRGKGFFK